ncbi:MAG: decarboxylase, partial [Clostridia bacterium]|nr:decarboxylase [Clostridia bacterium]
ADIVHRYGIPLIVDEAHGAHFLLGGGCPASAVSCGADVVVQSLHKTLPALTQTALLHRMTDRIPADVLRDAMAAYQSSSPSYLLMASIDACLRFMRDDGEPRMKAYLESLRRLRADIEALPGITLLDRLMAETAGGFDYDEGKLVIAARGLGGVELAARLREDYHLETELALPRYVLAMTSISDDEAGFDRLRQALTEISATLPPDEGRAPLDLAPLRLTQVHTPYEASRRPKEWVSIPNSGGRIAAGTVTPYPPGIPLIVAGERISVEAAARMTCPGVTLYGVSPDGTVAVEADE